MSVIPYLRFQEYQERRQVIRDRIILGFKKEVDAQAAVDSTTSPQEKKKK
jgi:hypothetical protein